jgi:hypothetical protein
LSTSAPSCCPSQELQNGGHCHLHRLSCPTVLLQGIASQLASCCLLYAAVHALLQERFEYIKSQLLPFLKTVGFRESSVQWLPAVGPAGQNLVGPPSEALLSRWWKGPTLVQAIDAFKPKPRNAGMGQRMQRRCCCGAGVTTQAGRGSDSSTGCALYELQGLRTTCFGGRPAGGTHFATVIPPRLPQPTAPALQSDYQACCRCSCCCS